MRISSKSRPLLMFFALALMPILSLSSPVSAATSYTVDDPVPGCTKEATPTASGLDAVTYKDINGSNHDSPEGCKEAVKYLCIPVHASGRTEKIEQSMIIKATNDNAAYWVKNGTSWESLSSCQQDAAREHALEKGTGDACYDAGIEGMSWILCPSLNNTSSTVGALDSVLGKLLEVKRDFYKTGSPTHQVWGQFRVIANVIMIIIFLFVIYSQITGYGIDNYGIKKILPRIIVIAVIINLSYLICQIVVDLSNIFGAGLNSMIRGMGSGIENDHGVAEFVTTIVGVLLAFLGGTAAIGGTVITAISGGGVMIVITLLIALIGILVALMVFFGMLGIRMLIIIACMILAPIAIASYVLPNTQWFYKKWWNIFKVALIIYPICGAVFGISALLKAMVLGMENTHPLLLIVLLFAPFLPFLFIPTLLIQAINTLGTVGSAISSVGRGVRGAGRNAQNAAKNSQAYKGLEEKARRNQTARRSALQLDKKGNIIRDANGNAKTRKLGRFGTFIRGGDAGIAAARSQYLADQEKAVKEQGIMSDISGANRMIGATMSGIESKAEDQRIGNAEAMVRSNQSMAEINGKMTKVNANNPEHMKAFYSQAIQRASNSSGAEREAALADVKAAQNIMSATEAGRSNIQGVLEKAAANGGDREVLQSAASHIMSGYGDKYKSVNRGSHAMISDLASGASPDSIQNKIKEGAYDMAGTDKYTPESLANADDGAIDRLEQSISSGRLTGASLSDIQGTARQALRNAEEGKLNLKPEIKTKLEKIANGTMATSSTDSSTNNTTSTDRITQSSASDAASEGESFNVGGGRNIINSAGQRSIDGLSNPAPSSTSPSPNQNNSSSGKAKPNPYLNNDPWRS